MIPRIELEMTGGSTLELFPTQVRQEAGEFIVGRSATGSYVALSDGALAAIELLGSGRTIVETKATLAAPRLRPLLETLLAAGLVKAVDGARLPEPLAPRRYHLTFLRRRHVAWLFSTPAVAAYALVVAVGAGTAFAQPRYLPRAADALVLSNPLENLALVWGVSLIAMAAHELAHLLAATFLGVQAGFALSNRLFFAVAQTDLTDLWLVDRRRRYIAYAAGMVNDVLLGSAAVIALWLHDQRLLPLSPSLYGTLRLVVLVLVFGVLWQFNVYLRTDMYYVIANLTGCRNLSQDAAAYLKAGLARLLTGAAAGAPEDVPEKERRIVRAFAVLMVLGTAGAIAVGAAYLGAVVLLLLGGTRGAGGQVAPAGPTPMLVSLAITCAWLAYAVVAKRRRGPRVRYRVVGPEDL